MMLEEGGQKSATQVVCLVLQDAVGAVLATLSRDLQLAEHADACWISLSDWRKLKWAPADVPIVESLEQKETGG